MGATPDKNHFLGVVLQAFKPTVRNASSTPIGNISCSRQTRYVVYEVDEESTPSSQFTTSTTLPNSVISSVMPSTLLSSTRSSGHQITSPISEVPVEADYQSSPGHLKVVNPMGEISEEVVDQSSKTDDGCNKSSFFLNLGACIDDIVFEHAYPRKAVSLYGIKKYLTEEYCYDSWHYRKSIRNYIVESLSSGQLEQVSGQGARGSFRLSQHYRKKYMRAKLDLDSFSVERVSKKSHSIKHMRQNINLSQRLITAARRKII